MASPFLISGKGGAYSGYYNAEFRTPTQLRFLYQKIAWATANGLSTPQGGGLGDKGLYSSASPSQAGVTDGARFVPKPHLVSVRVYNDGTMGTIRRCEVAFTVYSIGQLIGQQNFFKIGGPLAASFGWSTGDSESFSGKIINFSYSLNADGGFDCSSTAVGKGMAIPGLNPNASVKGDVTFTDALDKEFAGGSLWTNLSNRAANLVGADGKTSQWDGSVGGFAIEESWTTQPATPEEPIPEGQTKMYLYCSLASIVAEINKILTKAGGVGTIKQIVPWTKNMFSVAPGSVSPLTVLVGPGPYGAINFDPMTAVTTDPGQVAVSIEFLKTLCYDLEQDNNPAGLSRDITISNFFDRIFTEISESTGGVCKLTLAAADNNFDIIIADAEDTGPVTKGVITAVTQGGEARQMTVTSMLPSGVTSIAFVANNTDSVKVGSAKWSAFGMPKAKASVDQAAFDAAIKALSDSGAFPETVSAAKAQLAAYYKGQAQSGTVAIPIDFGVTVDGQSGWRWGMAVTSNYLPSIYQSADVYFTVTKVEHNVSGGDWTTTLQTLMRIVKL